MSKEHIETVLNQAEIYLLGLEQKYKKKSKNIANTIEYLRIYPKIADSIRRIKAIRSTLLKNPEVTFNALQILARDLDGLSTFQLTVKSKSKPKSGSSTKSK
jgi:hypothetical protein